MTGYYNDAEATAETFDNGWYRTGDFGYFDKDGFLFYVGREKNLIVLTNGKNVSPEELEDKFAAVDIVKEVLVYEEDGQITGEFYLDDTVSDGEKQLKDYVRELNKKTPAFKQITKVKFRKAGFPKTTTLKILRNR